MFDIFPSLPLFGFLVGEGLKYATRSPQQWAQEGDQIITPSGRQENLNSSPPFRVQNPWVFFWEGFKGQNPPGFCCYSTATFKGFLAQDSFSWSHILQVLPKPMPYSFPTTPGNGQDRRTFSHVSLWFGAALKPQKHRIWNTSMDMEEEEVTRVHSSYETNPKSYTTIVSGKPLKKT